MKKLKVLPGILSFLLISQFVFGQNDVQPFNLHGENPLTIVINQTFTSSQEIQPFGDISSIYGLALNAQITLQNDQSKIEVILVGSNFEEYLIYESYTLLESGNSVTVNNMCEETCVLDGIKPNSIRIEVKDGEIKLKNLKYTAGLIAGSDISMIKKEKKQAQNVAKIQKINKNLAAKGLKWFAGPTNVSELTYAEKKKLYGAGTFPPGFEYYSGGVIQVGEVSSLKSATASLMVEDFDWRNRHNQNWITPVTNQGNCGSCWAFAATGATEAMVNLYFNQHLNLDLSEQDVLSCSGAGDCGGGYPATALNYIANTGIVDEATFPYTATDQPCVNKGTDPNELIKIGGRIDFGVGDYPRTDDDLKRMIIERGPLSGGLYNWSHAMVLPGYHTVKEGDNFYYRDLTLSRYWKTVETGDPLIGKTVWIFKNSWGLGFGDNGYVYVETDISNIGWTHAVLPPVQSLIVNRSVECVDNDGDGYYWWGMGEKPAGCDCPDDPDGDDSNANLGPLDEYGYCTVLGNPPVANFSADDQTIFEGESVIFSDLSANNPTSRLWIFEGGDPGTSTEKYPVVTYNTIGTYDVTLMVINTEGSDTMTIADYISVEEYIPGYCPSNGNAVAEWIAGVQIGSQAETSVSSGTAGYENLTALTYNLEAGQTYDIVLEPGFNPKNKFEYWAIWIDFNNDYDFEDNGELIFSASKKRATVYGTITIPAGIDTTTRMRVSMSRSGIPDPCSIFDAGEVKDFTVSIGEPVLQFPVAAFTASATNVTVGSSVDFTDISIGNPTSRLWSFPGGEPNLSSELNPTIIYNSVGKYDVKLVVSNSVGSDSVLQTGYINVVDEIISEYCEPLNINSSSDWIQFVGIGTSLNNNSSGDGYSLNLSPVTLTPGSSYLVNLTPYNAQNKNFWRLWIDFNGDSDFDDADETLIIGNNKKGTFTTTISIPSYASGETRMRITMCTGSAPASCDNDFGGEVEDYIVSLGSSSLQLKNAKTGDSMAEIMNGFKLYPNPTNKVLNLHLDEIESGDRYIVFNSQGQIIYAKQINTNNIKIDVEKFASGLYVISIKNRGNILNEKFIKR